jgi:hypothetical protein
MTCNTSQCSTTFAVLVEPKDVDPGVLMITRPDSVAVQHDVVALGQHPRLNSTRFPGYSASIPLEVVDEGLLPITNVRVVLPLGLPGVLRNRLGRSRLVEHEVVEGLHVLLIPLEAVLGCHASSYLETGHFQLGSGTF